MPYANEQPVIREMVSLADDTWIIYAEHGRTPCMAIVHQRMITESAGVYYVHALNPDTYSIFRSCPTKTNTWSVSFESCDHNEMAMIQQCMNTVIHEHT